jgi:prepilin-type N-terminal cleavage/methylation domain-containing protein
MKGFTLVEILVVVGIMTVIILVVLSPFRSYSTLEKLQTDTLQVKSILDRARESTVSGKNGSRYGVHFETNRAVLFEGNSYDSSDTNNRVTDLNSAVTISNITLSSGGSDVVFQRLTGESTVSGSVVLTLVGTTTSRTISIQATGISNIQ